MSVHIIDEIDQAGARATLDRILQAAVSRALPDRQRRDLGAAATWLQRLIDQGLLPGTPVTSDRLGESGLQAEAPALALSVGFNSAARFAPPRVEDLAGRSR